MEFPNQERPILNMEFPNQLNPSQVLDLEAEVSIEEIKKIPNAKLVKDFRPISLIGSLYKIITKILANRIMLVLGDLVNEVQLAFVADRQILDGPFILNEVYPWCKEKKKQSFILKVDFEKAYDFVHWDYLHDVLRKFGFGDRWCGWIYECLRTSRGSVLVNGSPTKEFQFFKGLKQGDPLAPFLFILVMESLHISFNRVVEAGLFQGIVLNSSTQLSHLFFADDVVFMGQWNSNNIDTIIHVLKCFHLASGLNINLGKSKLMGIAVNDVINAWDDIVDKLVVRLSKWKMKTLSIGGRLTLLKAVLGAMVELNCKKAIWVKWCNVLASKEKGGLEVHAVKMQGFDILNYMQKKIGNGKDTFFWDDVWLGDTPLKYRFPRVYSLEVNKHADVASKMSQVNLSASLRRCPRGGAEQSQMGELIALLNDVVLGVMDDRWCWALDGMGEFSVASVRKALDALRLSCVSSQTRWIKEVPIKVNVLAWKVRLNCLPSRLNLSRRGLPIPSILCSMCGVAIESSSHIFFGCSEIWLNNIRMPSKLKKLLEGVCFVFWWHLWAYRNKLIFGVVPPLKADIFDSVVLLSFNWCRFRCKGTFRWNDWFKNSHLISL
nr:RNA-directed DNA polymerase, eukaryota, reverse transcriptase zinc-binding domain protein [Tanacetum cinerariifolium]